MILVAVLSRQRLCSCGTSGRQLRLPLPSLQIVTLSWLGLVPGNIQRDELFHGLVVPAGRDALGGGENPLARKEFGFGFDEAMLCRQRHAEATAAIADNPVVRAEHFLQPGD